MEEYLYSKKELIEIITRLEEEKKELIIEANKRISVYRENIVAKINKIETLEEALSTEREKHDILVNTLTKPELVSTHDAIKHLEQQLKDDGCEFVGC